jgi:hypothetical protein
MKRYLAIFLIGIVAFITSCSKDFLDKNNPSTISATDVWKDPTMVAAYVNHMYIYLPGYDYNLYNNISDEARSNYPGGPNSTLIGDWNELNTPMGNWSFAYGQIRIANDFFENIKTATVDDNVKKKSSAEVRFIRALHYLALVQRYGGVPLITESQKLDDDLQVSRKSSDEVFDFITKEADLAAADLPLNADRGRITKGAALALKTRAMLYWASPLFNPSNDAARWQKAADAAKAVIDLGKYDLHPDITKIWLDNSASHKEVILEKQYKLPFTSHGRDAQVKPVWLAKGDAGQCSPVQELINAFPMKNGKLINEPGSGYDAANPYVGRDDRFYAFIGYNQAKIGGIPAKPYPGVPAGQTTRNFVLEIYKGGSEYDSIPAYSIYNTVTGYYTVKGINHDNSIYSYGYGSEQPWIEYRYAEILLNYAEALNEAKSSPDPAIIDVLNKLRARAGISTPLTNNLSKDAMRALIRNERYIELCFEYHRYWDLRRWKIAHEVLHGKKMTGVVITKQPNRTFTYEYKPIDNLPLVFDQKMYFLPIPQDERTKNKNLTQNPGWPQ